jgi:uncharacterized protein (TIGR03437 family)
VDGITFDPSGNYLVAAGRTGSAPNDAPFLTVYGRNGGVVRQLPAEHYPDGGVFHTDPFYLAGNNNDGTITRYDFPNDDLRQAPSQSLIASGGFRGDLAEAGPDGCLYATQGGARYANGASTSENSVVRLCSPAGQFVSMAVARSGAPRIRDNDPVLPSFQGKSGFGSNMYVEIYGTNLAPATRLWSGADFKGPAAPTSLDGVSVTVNGKPAFIYYISPQQININTPDDTATGAVNIQVKTPQGPSNIVSAVRTRLSPALQSSAQFAAGGKQYVVAQTPDFLSFIGPPGLVPGANFTAARPGDTVSMYALGCGATNPATQAGVAASQNSPIAARFEMRIGGVAASVPFAGMVGGSIGLYQINAVIPNIAAGDQPVELIVDGVPNAQNLVITIGEPFP